MGLYSNSILVFLAACATPLPSTRPPNIVPTQSRFDFESLLSPIEQWAKLQFSRPFQVQFVSREELRKSMRHDCPCFAHRDEIISIFDLEPQSIGPASEAAGALADLGIESFPTTEEGRKILLDWAQDPSLPF